MIYHSKYITDFSFNALNHQGSLSSRVDDKRCCTTPDMKYYGGREGEERQSVRDSDRERPDLYKKEAEIFMDVSVLIGKPLGALQPPPPITAREEVNPHTHTHARTQTHAHARAGERRWSEGQSVASNPRDPCHPQPLQETGLPSPRLRHCYNHYQSCYHNRSLWHIWTGTTAQSAKSNTA